MLHHVIIMWSSRGQVGRIFSLSPARGVHLFPRSESSHRVGVLLRSASLQGAELGDTSTWNLHIQVTSGDIRWYPGDIRWYQVTSGDIRLYQVYLGMIETKKQETSRDTNPKFTENDTNVSVRQLFDFPTSDSRDYGEVFEGCLCHRCGF